jgi:uncharacterized membrane protein YidH (DUF202 family)
MNLKWIWVILLAIIGILAAFVAIEYLTVSIHHLPSFIPGHKPHKRGHYHKRGAIAAVIALIALAAAGYLAYRFTRGGSSSEGGTSGATDAGPAATGPAGTTDQLLGDSSPGGPAPA